MKNLVSTIRTDKLRKIYGHRQVVSDVSIQVSQGEIVGLLGPNGAGKTTTFYMIVGMVRPDAGHIFLDDIEMTDKPMYKRARLGVGYLPQEASIFRKLSVEDNIMAILETQDMKRAERKKKLEQLLEEFKITHIRKTKSMSCSGGERRRLEIARALASDPSFLLLDEPFAGIDPIAVADIQSIVHHFGTQRPRHGRTHHGPQRARNAFDYGPRLHHVQEPGAHGRFFATLGRRPRSTSHLSR